MSAKGPSVIVRVSQRVFRRVAQPAVEVAVLRALGLLPSNVDLSSAPRPRLMISLSESLHYQF